MTIVVGYIPTSEGRAALEEAAAEAERRQMRLIVVNSNEAGYKWDDTEEGSRLQKDFETIREKLDNVGVECELLALSSGEEASDDLIDVANKNDAALIVIGLRRRSLVGKLLLGSNAQKVMAEADCPVLAVKGS